MVRRCSTYFSAGEQLQRGICAQHNSRNAGTRRHRLGGSGEGTRMHPEVQRRSAPGCGMTSGTAEGWMERTPLCPTRTTEHQPRQKGGKEEEEGGGGRGVLLSKRGGSMARTRDPTAPAGQEAQGSAWLQLSNVSNHQTAISDGRGQPRDLRSPWSQTTIPTLHYVQITTFKPGLFVCAGFK